MEIFSRKKTNILWILLPFLGINSSQILPNYIKIMWFVMDYYYSNFLVCYFLGFYRMINLNVLSVFKNFWVC